MHYELLQPVIGLSLLDAVYQPESESFYHHYRLVENGMPGEVIEGLQLVFIELPKVKLDVLEPSLRQAWLRFLNETGDADTPAEAKALEQALATQAPELGEALELAAEAAFTPGELMAYDRYWDAVSTERTLLIGKTREALKRGLEEGLELGKQQGLELGKQQGLELGKQQGLELGKQQGLAEGLAEGLEAGRAAERQALLARLIASGMSEAEARRLLG
jgi:flagellar biosynthesis/type III secretory pathway protein FliH